MKLSDGFKNLKIPTVTQLINIELCKFFYKLLNNMLPTNLIKCALLDSKGTTLQKLHHYDTCKKHLPNLPLVQDLQYKNSFRTHSNVLYNELPETVQNSVHLADFAKKLKEFVIQKP